MPRATAPRSPARHSRSSGSSPSSHRAPRADTVALVARKTIKLDIDPDLLAEAAADLGTKSDTDTVRAALERVVGMARDRIDSKSFPTITREHLERMREHGDE